MYKIYAVKGNLGFACKLDVQKIGAPNPYFDKGPHNAPLRHCLYQSLRLMNTNKYSMNFMNKHYN